MKYTHEQLISIAKITSKDMELIRQCRWQHNKLGFGYQLCFVRLLNRFPSQYVFEVLEDLLNYMSTQLNIPYEAIQIYTQRRQTIDEHQQRISEYLGLSRFSNNIINSLIAVQNNW